MASRSEYAITLARDILGGEVRAVWTADWPHVMAEGILELNESLSKEVGTMTTLTDIDFAHQTAERQLEIPGMDGYVAERLAVTLSGGVEFTDVTQAEDVAFVKSLRLGQ